MQEINKIFNNIGNAGEDKKYHGYNFSLFQKLKSRASFIQLKPILDIFLRVFSLSNCPQHSLKVPLALIHLAPKCRVSFKVCAQL
jgi:hypothetical protein